MEARKSGYQRKTSVNLKRDPRALMAETPGSSSDSSLQDPIVSAEKETNPDQELRPAVYDGKLSTAI
uniref:Uncharacterized protein n=1 Tax=Cucumis melo TaxID=3656 RepID=A0A9I9DCQ0_CUCME